MTALRSSPARLTGCVLVIDDQPHHRRALGDLLGSRGHRVLEAADAKDGLALARHERPDVVLLDLALAGSSGFEICRQLKADPLCASIPVLLVTSNDDRDARLNGMRAGANDFIVRPVDDAELLLRIRNGIFTRRLFERQERQYRRLQELEALRDSLVHLVIHDLRSPLAGVHLIGQARCRALSEGQRSESRRQAARLAVPATRSRRQGRLTRRRRAAARGDPGEAERARLRLEREIRPAA
jgi:CheY-like chemotaxis protein